MSIRGIWVINPQAALKVIFSRRFPTVEQHARQRHGDLYKALPADTDWCSLILSTHVEPSSDDEYVVERDSCMRREEPPVMEVAGGFWPLVYLRRHYMLFCCLPMVDSIGTPDHRPAFVDLPGITVGLEMLEQLAAFLGEDCSKFDPADLRLCELHCVLNVAIPFGTPLHFQLSTANSLLQARPPGPSGKEKQVAWKPFPYKGSNRFSVVLQERIRAAQYDRMDVTDVWQVTGSIKCKAELEGVPEVSLGLSVPANGHPLDYLLMHPCVLNGEAHPSKGPFSPSTAKTNILSPRTRRLTFSPPLDTFELCRYEAKNVPLPIRGFYQMKGDRTIKLLVQLKLAEGVKNSFEFCELRLPFFHRGTISNVDYLPNSAQVSVAPDHRTLVWTIGQKFPSRSLEVSLNATVTFNTLEDLPDDDKKKDFKEDTFCVGLNAYADLNFKIIEYTASGCYVDPKTVSLYPNARYKLNSSRELVTDSYRIWNSHGDAHLVHTPS